jgi:hypothetical protein
MSLHTGGMKSPTVNTSCDSISEIGKSKLRNPTLPEKMKIIDKWFRKIQVTAFKANNKPRKSVMSK